MKRPPFRRGGVRWVGLAGAGSGCRVGEGHPLLVHPLGLRAHDEAEEVLVWNGGPSCRRRGGSAALVVQTGSLEERTSQSGLWVLKQASFHRALC